MVKRDFSGTLSLTLAELSARRQANLARFGRDFAHGLYGIGPHPELIGQPAAAAGTPEQAQLTPEVRKLLGAVDTKSNFLPANVTGRVTAPGAKPGEPLALVLNGKVAAVGWSAGLKGDKRVYFSFFAAPEAFRDGANSARVYKIPG
jgi:hypothetical protein